MARKRQYRPVRAQWVAYTRKRRRQTMARNLLTLSEYPYKISVLQKHSSSGGGGISQVIHTCDPSICTDWASLAALFDLYHVTKVHITAYPSFNDNYAGGVGPYNPIYIVYDADSTTIPATEDAMIQYGNCKTKNLFKQWKYVISPINAGDNSVNNAGMVTFQKYNKTYLDVANVAYYQKGVVGWLALAEPASLQFFTLKIDFYVSFANRR